MKEITELLKGVLEGCVLEIIGQGETYGYEITQKLRELGFEDVVEGTVYTITMRLEKRKRLEVTKKPSTIGPSRKWYRLNEAGQTERQNFWEKWMFISEKLEILRDKTKFTTDQGENDD
ncbi:PadR family transcriptional regulator [Lactococcus cremoris]|uniref:PadR family transcriptional regulator n=1 Tax=Lactococcus cremoris subsp. tructae TaxID=542833 RepID=A0A2A5SRU7_LACLC|nr:PadR family transcriptional regulator [Lactococcus cremoris]PCS17501.1 PadR family transcriptional regulator [Lactococcus cremoris subsp. tructae]